MDEVVIQRTERRQSLIMLQVTANDVMLSSLYEYSESIRFDLLSVYARL